MENENVEIGLIEESGCFLCGVKTDKRCEICGIEFCDLHESSHRGTIREGGREMPVCLPYRVVWREGVGRCVVATQDIQPLEAIIQDQAAMVGPNYETHAVCLHCLGGVTGEVVCDLCNFPFCSEECLQDYKDSISDGENNLSKVGHHVECSVFRKLDKKLVVTNVKPGSIAYEYCSVSVLRLLYLRDKDKDVWTRLHFLMDHDEDRRKEEMYWKMFQVNVVNFLRDRCNLAEVYSAREIEWAIGILRTNAANLERPYMTAQGTSGKVIYPTFSFLSHSCICNARYIVNSDDSVDVRAQVPIKKGEEISIQYITFLFGNLKRRQDIKAAWMFECTCERCTDVTEFGTNLSGMKCQKCGNVVLPISSDIDEETWKCKSCDWSMTTETVMQTFQELETKMFDTYETDIERYETLIEDYSKVLWDNHFQILLLKCYLASALTGKVTLDQIKQKVKLNQEFLDVFSTVDPGCTKWRAKHLYEISQTKLFLADMQHATQEITKEEFLKTLKGCISDLGECTGILRYEAEGTKEFYIRRRAMQSLAQAKDILMFASMMNM